jgi:hypothetical protein
MHALLLFNRAQGRRGRAYATFPIVIRGVNFRRELLDILFDILVTKSN